jgi:hypothetical protein
LSPLLAPLVAAGVCTLVQHAAPASAALASASAGEVDAVTVSEPVASVESVVLEPWAAPRDFRLIAAAEPAARSSAQIAVRRTVAERRPARRERVGERSRFMARAQLA